MRRMSSFGRGVDVDVHVDVDMWRERWVLGVTCWIKCSACAMYRNLYESVISV